MKTGIELIAEERQRQIEEEGWTTEHDALHTNGELADAAACYAVTDNTRMFARFRHRFSIEHIIWPFESNAFKRGNRIRDLQKAGALIAAEIDRLLND